jgi:hypothetical protein
MKKLLIVLFVDLILFFSSYDWTCRKINLHQEAVKAGCQEAVEPERVCSVYSEYIIIV